MAIRLSLSELAGRTDGKIICGEAGSLFSGMASLDAAGPEDISFLGNEKYIHDFHSTKAGAVIVPEGYDFKTDGPALIAVPNPTLAFSEVVAHFAAVAENFHPGIHPSAVVSPEADLDPAKVRAQSGAVVMEGSRIGDGTEISPNAVIHETSRLAKTAGSARMYPSARAAYSGTVSSSIPVPLSARTVTAISLSTADI